MIKYIHGDNVNVFTTGLGKVRHPRRLYATTDGDVRDGPLDELKETGDAILNGLQDDDGMLVFICCLDSPDEVHDPANWEKANPSLPYRPDLRAEIEKEYKEWKRNPQTLSAFMTKRMNLPQSDADVAVTEYAYIKRTNRPLPEMDGWDCVAGVDFVKVGDFASADLHFRQGDKRYDINHSWLCTSSKDLPRIKAPWRDWVRDKHLTLVDGVEIHPDMICEYLYTMGRRYNILKLAVDNFRYALLAKSLETIGFDAHERKNVKLVRPQDIMKVVPVIDSCFNNDYFTWGNNPPLRWGVNNTKLVRSSKSIGSDTGNYYYAKIEGRSRKTDPFMAVVAAMTIEDELSGSNLFDIPDIGMLTW